MQAQKRVSLVVVSMVSALLWPLILSLSLALALSPAAGAAELSVAGLSAATLAEAADRRDAAAPVWAEALAADDPALLMAAARGLGRIGGSARLAQLAPLLAHRDPAVRAEAAFAIGILDIPAEAQSPEPLPSAALALQAEQERLLQLRLSLEPESSVRQVLLLALGNSGGVTSQTLLRDYRLTGLAAEEQAAWAQAVGLLWSYRRSALPAIDPALVQRLLALTTSAESVAEMAAFALARARREPLVQAEVGALTKAFAASRSAGARIFLLRALASTITEQNQRQWLKAQQRQQLAGRKFNAAERIELATVLASNLNGSALRTAVANGLRSAQAAERLAIIQALANRPVEANALRDLWLAHAALQPGDGGWLAPLLEPAHGESETADEAAEPVSATTAYASAATFVGTRYRLHTVRGVIDIELLPDAVYSVANFARLANRGYYQNSRFHRVIGNFVAQGGDPTGTGEGGPGWRIREELSRLPHAPGYVGMATAGKDTAGSQFFINTGRNPHLDWHYTVFARVIAGLDVAYALLPGDALYAVTQLP